MIKNGGYTMLDLATATYKDAAAAFNANKPIMVYDNSQVYYADTCVYDSDNDAYVLTKGGKTITIDNDNNVASSGDILTIMENIVDSQGNKRFIEGNINIETITGVTKTYGKWSLSGMHLMIVLCLQIANETTLTTSDRMAIISLPQWVIDKIAPLYNNYVDRKTILSLGSGADTTYDFTLRKISNVVSIYSINQTTTRDENIRIQFDLLIDTE